jgi:hypothetical protein
MAHLMVAVNTAGAPLLLLTPVVRPSIGFGIKYLMLMFLPQSNSPAKENGDSGRKSLPPPPVSRGTVSADEANEGLPRAAAAWTAEPAAPKDEGGLLGKIFGFGSNEARDGGTPAGVGKGPASPDFVRRRSSLALELDEVHEEIFELHTEMEVMHRALHQVGRPATAHPRRRPRPSLPRPSTPPARRCA